MATQKQVVFRGCYRYLKKKTLHFSDVRHRLGDVFGDVKSSSDPLISGEMVLWIIFLPSF